MIKNKITMLVVAAVLTLTSLGVSANVSAASSVAGKGITTSPISLNLSVKPGTSVSSQLLVENNNTSPIEISLKVDKFSSDNIDGHPKIYAATAGDPSVDWVHFNKNNFIAQPNVWTPVTMTINLPSTASLGYYYAILFTPKTGVKTNSNTVATTYRGSNAVLVLVDTHSSNEVKALQVAKFTSVKSVYQYLPATFNIDVKNSGNIQLVPQGDVYISRSANNTKTLASLDINPSQGNVLPYSERTFQTEWSNGFPVYKPKKVNGHVVSNKNGQTEQTLSWNLSNPGQFRFGKYYAHLVMVYSNGNQDIPVDAVVSFWVIPWTLIIMGLIVLLIIGFGLWAIIRSMIRPLKKQPKESKEPKKPTSKLPVTRYRP